MFAHSAVAAVSDRRRRSEIDATISVRPYRSGALPNERATGQAGGINIFDTQYGDLLAGFQEKRHQGATMNQAPRGGDVRLSVKALAIVCGLVWGAGVLGVGLVHLARPSYGASFLEGISSIYPGFHGARTLGDAVVGGIYGLIDGGVGGFFVGWLYNVFAGRAS